MKKKNIAYRRRIIVIIALSVIVAVGACSLILYGIIGVPTEQVVPRAAYSCVSEISYFPILKEGALYKDGNIEFGAHYITSYVDRLRLNCKYDFVGDNASDMHGNYSITATLQGIHNNIVIWKKEYQLVNEQKFTRNKMQKSILLELGDYRSFIDELEKETGIKFDVNMNISYGVNMSAVVGGSTVNEASLSTLQFSMKDLLMQFSGEPVSRLEKTIDEVITTETKLSNELLIANIAILALALASLVYIIFFTAGQRPDPAKRQLKKIFKQYGDRIVELKSNAIPSADNMMVVSSFRDLLLAADELKRPILKIGEEDYRSTSFYVMDEARQYVFHAQSLADKPYKEARRPAYSVKI
mgnify:CR=1 FL=1